MLMGIDPILEPTLSQFLDGLVKGRLPAPGQNEILVGDGMVRQLVVDIGDTVVVVAPGADGSMGNDLFARTGMAWLEDRRPEKLSGGQQQRVAVVRAVVGQPALVLADEPTTNFDTVATEALLDVMFELNQETSVTFVFATHDSRVMERSRRLVGMMDGGLEYDATRPA